MIHSCRRRLILISLAAALAIAVFAQGRPARISSQSKEEFIDSKLCVGCHAAIYDSDRHSGMARAFYRPSPANTIEDYSQGNPFYHAPTAAYYAMEQRGGRYYQQRWLIGPDGQPAYRQERPIIRDGFGESCADLLTPGSEWSSHRAAVGLVFGEGRLLGDESGLRCGPFHRAAQDCLRMHVLP
jgi:hypothetical protein